MAVLIFTRHEIFIVTLISIALFCCYSSGYAEDSPAQLQLLAKALMCFNNKFIYIGCDEAYRLNKSGNMNVPPELTDAFCNGPCLAETQLVLTCVDNILSNFLSYNKATTRAIKSALQAGCSYTGERGNFNVGRYIQGQGETSTAFRLERARRYPFLAVISVCCFWLSYWL